MENYKKIKLDITKIINNIDPWGLISAGAPEDEYDGMINQTLSLQIDKKLNKENLKEIWESPELNEDAISEIIEKVSDYFSKSLNIYSTKI